MIYDVRDAYTPGDFWSNVAKRSCRRLLFYRPRLEWRRTIRDFLEEYATAEERMGYILESTREPFREFVARLTCRLRRMGDITEAEQASVLAALRNESPVPDVRGERAKALILKTCLEIGRRRPRYQPPASSVTELFRCVRTVQEMVETKIDSPLPNPGRLEYLGLVLTSDVLARARSTPEYHVALLAS
jgi:hypothetical protein